ncbi:MAG: hypothetical protein WC707_06805 [Candidatus Babeliaceae bacterium]|jgi:hypothetical protein
MNKKEIKAEVKKLQERIAFISTVRAIHKEILKDRSKSKRKKVR